MDHYWLEYNLALYCRQNVGIERFKYEMDHRLDIKGMCCITNFSGWCSFLYLSMHISDFRVNTKEYRIF